jgi:pilus assembly protein Flp/PilA
MWTDLKVWTSELIARFSNVRDEEGQALVEYGLILALVSVVAIAVLTLLGSGVTSTLQSVVNAL